MTKRERRRLSDDGLPIDAKAWTEADWRDLHEAIETMKRKVSERHAREPVSTAVGSGDAQPDTGREVDA